MRLNDTTRAYFERLATISHTGGGGALQRNPGPGESSGASTIFRQNEPMHWSMLRTSISPTIIKAASA